jgi:hypothetical protein
MKDTTVIACVYNSPSVVGTAIGGSLARSGHSRFVFVDNHEVTGESIKRVAEECRQTASCLRTTILRPDRNLGCHGGWNYGWSYVRAKWPGYAVAKLDDDTEMLTHGWDVIMADALDQVPELGFVSADIDAKQHNKYELRNINGVDLEVATEGIVGFSCVMFRQADIMRWGPMAATYRTALGVPIHDTEGATLYGGEEVYYADKARAEGKIIAHLPAAKAHHLGNEERHPDYPGWKWFYGYMGLTRLDMAAWLALPPEHPEAPGALWLRRLAMELRPPTPNDCNLRDCLLAIVRHGKPLAQDERDIIGRAVRAKTRNGVVLEALAKVEGKP